MRGKFLLNLFSMIFCFVFLFASFSCKTASKSVEEAEPETAQIAPEAVQPAEETNIADPDSSDTVKAEEISEPEIAEAEEMPAPAESGETEKRAETKSITDVQLIKIIKSYEDKISSEDSENQDVQQQKKK